MEEKSLKILIVEDEEISWNLYKLWLKNYNLSFSDSEKSMYDKLSNNNFQLIIVDIGLPDSKEGLSLIKELKANTDFLKIPIACITSYDSLDQSANVLNAGADVYLVKPVSRNILIDVITKFQL